MAMKEFVNCSIPIRISLLCDGQESNSYYRAADVLPEMRRARELGVYYKVIGFVPKSLRRTMDSFRASLEFTQEETALYYYDTGDKDEMTQTAFEDLASSHSVC